MRKEDKAWLAALAVAAGFLFAALFHYFRGYYYFDGYPRNTFLFDPANGGYDFYNIYHPTRELKPYDAFTSVYFPFAYVPMLPFAVFKPRFALALFLVVFSVFTFRFLWQRFDFVPRAARATLAFVIGFMSYPFLFCVDRGNLEALVFVFLALFLSAFEAGRSRRAVAYLAAASAMKLYPGVFALLYVSRKRYREFFATIALAALLTLASAAAYPGGIIGSFSALAENLRLFKISMMLGDAGLKFNSSYFGLIKLAAFPVGPLSPEQVRDYLMWPYGVGAFVVFLFWAWFAVYRERVLWKQATILCFSIILLPQVSFDYKLIHLLIPFALFLNAPPEAGATRDWAYLLGFSLLLVPKAYGWIRADVNIGVVLNPLIMTAMIVGIMTERLRARPALPPA